MVAVRCECRASVARLENSQRELDDGRDDVVDKYGCGHIFREPGGRWSNASCRSPVAVRTLPGIHRTRPPIFWFIDFLFLGAVRGHAASLAWRGILRRTACTSASIVQDRVRRRACDGYL